MKQARHPMRAQHRLDAADGPAVRRWRAWERDAHLWVATHAICVRMHGFAVWSVNDGRVSAWDPIALVESLHCALLESGRDWAHNSMTNFRRCQERCDLRSLRLQLGFDELEG